MKHALLIALTFSGVAAAQSDTQLVSTDLSRRPDRRSDFKITNNAKAALTSFAVVSETRPNGRPPSKVQADVSLSELFGMLGLLEGWGWRPREEEVFLIEDSVRNRPFQRPIMPGETRRLVLGGVRSESGETWDPEVSLKAALFEDGTTFGDPEWIDKLVNTRRAYLKATRLILRELGSSAGASRESLIARLKQLSELEQATAQSSHNRNVIAAAFSTAFGNIEDARTSEGNLPAVEEVVRMLVKQFSEYEKRVRLSRPPIEQLAVRKGRAVARFGQRKP